MPSATTKAHTPPRRDQRRERGTACWNFTTQPVVKAFIFRRRAATLLLQVCLPSPFQIAAPFPVRESGSLHVEASFPIQEQDPLQIQAPFPIQERGLFEIGTPLQVPAPFPVSEPFPTRLQVCLQMWPWTQLRQPVQIQFQTNVDQESRRPSGRRRRCHQGELGGACSAASHCSKSYPLN
ncbi:hypothetical protein HPB48_022247 [Haemaphysalis longicornis]|uniref:Uncharacterized protein n=1 Tax=Haemaphysalis longicornis TaxID=44386 RepID=A0A9J6GKE8_HAELO|nr:hypothetical protein HPB48_022247 [Haemaphysalis longicornis]